jgi:hypothetical protein
LPAEDRVRVVETGDIYKEGDFSYMMNNPAINNQRFPGVNMQPSNVLPAGINFAPIIRINNGGTDYTNESSGDTPKISFENMESPVKNIEPEKSIVFKKEIQGQPQAQSDSKQGGGGDGGMFSGIKNYIIKKLS